MERYRKIERAATEELEPLRDDETSVRVWTELSDDAWQIVAAWLSARPDVQLSVERGTDLEMLRFFPGLRRLRASSLRLGSLDGVRHVADSLERLSIGDSIPRVSLRPLEQLRGLRALDVNGTWADRDSIGRLTGLRELGIGSIDLVVLRPLQELVRLHSGLGTVSSLDLLPEIGRLELLELFRLRGTHHLAAVARMPHLRWLSLESTHSITALPSFRDCPSLRWVVLDRMRGILDLRPIADAPGLEVLVLLELSQLEPEDLRPFVGHPALRIVNYGFRSKAKQRAAQALLPPTGDRLRGPEWTWPEWDGTPHWDAAGV